MGQFNNFVLRSRHRQVFTVPAVAGNYANERLTIGAVGSGELEGSYYGFTALVESAIANAVVELWVPRVADGTQAASARTDADYVNSGLQTASSTGVVSWTLGGGWVGGQIRVKSGGSGGSMAVSATAL